MVTVYLPVTHVTAVTLLVTPLRYGYSPPLPPAVWLPYLRLVTFDSHVWFSSYGLHVALHYPHTFYPRFCTRTVTHGCTFTRTFTTVVRWLRLHALHAVHGYRLHVCVVRLGYGCVLRFGCLPHFTRLRTARVYVLPPVTHRTHIHGYWLPHGLVYRFICRSGWLDYRGSVISHLCCRFIPPLPVLVLLHGCWLRFWLRTVTAFCRLWLPALFRFWFCVLPYGWLPPYTVLQLVAVTHTHTLRCSFATGSRTHCCYHTATHGYTLPALLIFPRFVPVVHAHRGSRACVTHYHCGCTAPRVIHAGCAG